MLYSKEKASNIEKKDFTLKYIPAGIIENVVLKEARTDVSPTGKKFLEITFEKEGAILTHTEWEPLKNQYTDTDEKLQTKAINQYSRMLQILTCFYKDEEIDFNGEDFTDFAKYIVNKLNSANKEIKLRVKIVYNKDGYTTLPSYAKYTFIEPMELPEGETSKISELSIDQFTKPIIADKETNSNNPFESNTLNNNVTPDSNVTPEGTSQNSDSDLPF